MELLASTSVSPTNGRIVSAHARHHAFKHKSDHERLLDEIGDTSIKRRNLALASPSSHRS
jgi:hypothetical protein